MSMKWNCTDRKNYIDVFGRFIAFFKWTSTSKYTAFESNDAIYQNPILLPLTVTEFKRFLFMPTKYI